MHLHHTLAFVLVTSLIVSAPPAPASAQGQVASGQLTLIRIGTSQLVTGGLPKPSLFFRMTGSSRTFILDLDSRRDDDGGFASRMHMASLLEDAFRSGQTVTIEYLGVTGDSALVQSVQMQTDRGQTRPPSSATSL